MHSKDMLERFFSAYERKEFADFFLEFTQKQAQEASLVKANDSETTNEKSKNLK